MTARKRALALVLSGLLLVSVASTPVAAATLSIDSVDLPNSVTQGAEFDITVSVSGSDVENVETTLSLPDGLSCSPAGTQSVSLTNGEGTATFSCTADVPGEYDGDIGVTVIGDRTESSGTIDDQTRTGISVLSPASLTLSTSVDSTTIDEGTTTKLTAVVHNTGDASTSYNTSVSTGSGISTSTSDSNGTIAGGDISTVTYTLTGDASGEHTVELTVTGGNEQTLNESQTLTVEATGGSGGTSNDSNDSDDDSDDTDDADDSTSSGVDSTTGTDDADSTVDKLIPETEAVSTDSQALADMDPDRSGIQVSFNETERTETLTFDNENATQSGTVEVREATAVPDNLSSPEGTVRAAIDITVPESVANESATIQFRLSMDDIETSPEQVVLQHYHAETDTWTELDTNIVETNENVVRFAAETPGFSLFAVTESAVQESTPEATATTTAAPTTTATSDPLTTTTAESGSESESETESSTMRTTETSAPGFTAVLAALAILSIALWGSRRNEW